MTLLAAPTLIILLLELVLIREPDNKNDQTVFFLSKFNESVKNTSPCSHLEMHPITTTSLALYVPISVVAALDDVHRHGRDQVRREPRARLSAQQAAKCHFSLITGFILKTDPKTPGAPAAGAPTLQGWGLSSDQIRK